MDLRRVRFLLVEDNREMGEIIRSLLATWGGTQVATADGVKAAISHLERSSFDVAIVDQKLGDGSGLELVRLVRRSPVAFLPVLLVTAHASGKVVAEARDSGVNEVLAKPFTAAKLYERLHRLVFEARAFVTAPDYVGPDRRRRIDPDYAGPERRRP